MGPRTIVGEADALTESIQGEISQRFDLNLQPFPTPSSDCDGAAAAVGACCYFAPKALPKTQGVGSGTGGGTTVAESSAGTLTFSDATSSASIDSFAYANGAYARAPAEYATPVWRAGDTLVLSAEGGPQIGAFTVSAPALLPPQVDVLTPAASGRGVALSWQSDANAETFILQLGDGTSASIACSAPDAAGSLTIDASLVGRFATSSRLIGLAGRVTTRYAQTPMGRVAFKSLGYTTLSL